MNLMHLVDPVRDAEAHLDELQRRSDARDERIALEEASIWDKLEAGDQSMLDEIGDYMSNDWPAILCMRTTKGMQAGIDALNESLERAVNAEARRRVV